MSSTSSTFFGPRLETEMAKLECQRVSEATLRDVDAYLLSMLRALTNAINAFQQVNVDATRNPYLARVKNELLWRLSMLRDGQASLVLNIHDWVELQVKNGLPVCL
jgi:hypothetical protein